MLSNKTDFEYKNNNNNVYFLKNHFQTTYFNTIFFEKNVITCMMYVWLTKQTPTLPPVEIKGFIGNKKFTV